MKNLLLNRFSAGVLLCSFLGACSASTCGDVAVGRQASGLQIEVGKGELKRIGGEFFGFNLESAEFQMSLWNRDTRRVRPEVVSVLGQFEGAVYRFPGGTTANFYRWADGVGEVARRRPVRIVEWAELPRIDFGLDEYLKFIADVHGQAWYVLNLQGSLGKPADRDTLAKEAHDLVKHVRGKAVPVLRWELGNELDRGQGMWSSEKYIDRARAVAAAVRAADPEARFVGMMADYDAQESRGVTASDYNRAVAKGLKGSQVSDYEQHLYYDGPPEGPELPNRLGQLCRSIEDARASGVRAKDLSFWVTEHARWPQGEPGKAWNLSWKKTADLGAAIGVTDLLIALTQIPEVRGSAIHTLHGMSGPWPMFHQAADAGHDKALVPSVTMHAYSLLNRAMLPVVLPSKSSSGSRSGYGGGYDARGAVLTTPGRDRFSVWTVNRDKAELTVTLKMPELAGRQATAELHYMNAAELEANNYERPNTVLPRQAQRRLIFDSSGTATYTVPGLSLAALSMRPSD